MCTKEEREREGEKEAEEEETDLQELRWAMFPRATRGCDLVVHFFSCEDSSLEV